MKRVGCYLSCARVDMNSNRKWTEYDENVETKNLEFVTDDDKCRVAHRSSWEMKCSQSFHMRIIVEQTANVYLRRMKQYFMLFAVCCVQFSYQELCVCVCRAHSKRTKQKNSQAKSGCSEWRKQFDCIRFRSIKMCLTICAVGSRIFVRISL